MLFWEKSGLMLRAVIVFFFLVIYLYVPDTYLSLNSLTAEVRESILLWKDIACEIEVSLNAMEVRNFHLHEHHHHYQKHTLFPNFKIWNQFSKAHSLKYFQWEKYWNFILPKLIIIVGNLVSKWIKKTLKRLKEKTLQVVAYQSIQSRNSISLKNLSGDYFVMFHAW